MTSYSVAVDPMRTSTTDGVERGQDHSRKPSIGGAIGLYTISRFDGGPIAMGVAAVSTLFGPWGRREAY